MKLATKLRRLSDKVVDYIRNNPGKPRAELSDYVLVAFSGLVHMTTDDYLKSTKCDHSIRFDQDCSECNKF